MIKYVLTILMCLIIWQLALSQKTILWKITNETETKTSFIVGTFHQFGNSFVDSIPQIKEVLISAEIAVFESVDKVEATRKMMNERMASYKIEKKFKKNDLKALKEVTKDWKVDLYKLKPIEIRWKLEQELQRIKCQTAKPTDDFDHFDNYLIHLAEQNDIELLGLETDSFQLSMIEQENDFPKWKKERKLINKLVNQISSNDLDGFDCRFANKYRQFDLDYAFEEACETTLLNSQRNDDWMQILPDLLRTKNAFVAVGYLHLKRQCGILEQLKKEGFKIEAVNIIPAL